ncbi:MAG TPA: DUF1846 domain-containing protein [Candidatus Goldiibacteriota bacterium]|nr:DUF1846 domain-containing protein [Candidatus Goldiibacteriota bacterium]
MILKNGFDNEKYLNEQTSFILERVNKSQKLYLEFGGKLMFDYHAARVLPGYDPNVKLRLLQKMKDKAGILIAIYAGAIEVKKMRADFGITYDMDVLKLIDDLRECELDVLGVVITRFEGQIAAQQFMNKLKRMGVKVYTHKYTKGYPTDVDLIVSDEGYGANDYIETDKKLIVVTGPGPNSGKLATCLSQLYHDHKRGVKSAYSKFETFPIWNLPLKHPANVAYEAATLDIKDFNLIDPFHLEAYGKTSVNYNRDVECFPVIRRILKKIMDEKDVYKSPTDMGVNRAGFGIVDDAVVREASKQEVIRRYFRCKCEYIMGLTDKEAVERAELLMEELDVKPEDRSVVVPARQASQDGEKKNKGNEGIYCGAAIELNDGTIITGKNSPTMHAASSVILNAIKHMAEIPDKIHVLAPFITESISAFKKDILKKKTVSLDLDETLIALSISAATNPTAKAAMEKLTELRGCEVHISHLPTPGDEAGLKRLGVNLTSDPQFSTKSLFVG